MCNDTYVVHSYTDNPTSLSCLGNPSSLRLKMVLMRHLLMLLLIDLLTVMWVFWWKEKIEKKVQVNIDVAMDVVSSILLPIVFSLVAKGSQSAYPFQKLDDRFRGLCSNAQPIVDPPNIPFYLLLLGYRSRLLLPKYLT